MSIRPEYRTLGNFLGVEERPATGQNPITAIRLSDEMRESVDAWAGRQDDTPNRSEAIRRRVELGLKVKVKCKLGPRPAGRPWTPAEDAQLLALLDSKMDRPSIARKLKRTVSAIARRRSILNKRGLKVKK